LREGKAEERMKKWTQANRLALMLPFLVPSAVPCSAREPYCIENEGVPPGIEVEMDPKAWREGRDPQLEKAVQVLLHDLKEHPLPKPVVPPFPVYYHNH
jgi:hypothetical protein